MTAAQGTTLLEELHKYISIRDKTAEALDLLSNGGDPSFLVPDIERRLNECDFTKVSGATHVAPLHSLNRYINNSSALKEQLVQANLFISKIMASIESITGPFFTRKEILDMTTNGRETEDLKTKTPGNLFRPLIFKTYTDGKTTVQADFEAGVYRVLNPSGGYFPIKRFAF